MTHGQFWKKMGIVERALRTASSKFNSYSALTCDVPWNYNIPGEYQAALDNLKVAVTVFETLGPKAITRSRKKGKHHG